MKHKDLKVGDIVRVTDGSYSVRVDTYKSTCNFIGKSTDYFIVLDLGSYKSSVLQTRGSIFEDQSPVHDIFIKNTANGRVYLHSARFVELIKPITKTLTIEVTDEQAKAVMEALK